MAALRDLIVARMKEIGVRALFGVPGGGGNLDLIDAACRTDLRFVLTATETGGALAAMAQAEVLQRPGACLTTLGPGASSVANGVACAYLDRVPILVFTDCHASASEGAFEHQQFDHRAFFQPITKWSGRLTPECARRTFEQAVTSLLDVPPGPVHLDWPEDAESAARDSGLGARASALGVDAVESPSSRRDGPASRLTSPEPRAPSPGSPAFETALTRARRPIVIVGLGARRPEVARGICDLLTRRSIPAMVTYKAKGVVPDYHPCFAGVFTNAAIERSIVSSSDLILGIGLDPVELLPRPWPYRQPTVYAGAWRVSDRQVPFAAQRVGDIETALAEFDALIGSCEWDLDDVRDRVRNQRQGIDITGDTGQMTSQRVVSVAAERLARHTRVTVDAGAHMFPATMLWPSGEPNQMLISNGLSTMGFALPAAIGAALADRDRPVVALTGDGGLLMCAAELLTAVREKLRIITIVFSDRSLSLIEIKQQRRRYQPAGVALGDIDWPKLAEGFGVAPFVADSEAALESAIEQASRESGPCLIEARIDRSNYSRTLEAIRG
jgi:acetolactate synthase-1/2/3 large subunit